MTARRVSQDTAIAGAAVAAGDLWDVVDISVTTDGPAGTNKKITTAEARIALGGLSADYELALGSHSTAGGYEYLFDPNVATETDGWRRQVLWNSADGVYGDNFKWGPDTAIVQMGLTALNVPASVDATEPRQLNIDYYVQVDDGTKWAQSFLDNQILGNGTGRVAQIQAATDLGEINLECNDTHAQLRAKAYSGQTDAVFKASNSANASIIEVTGDDKIGFFGAAPVTQRTGVALSTAGIHAALVSLGLITA